MSLQFQQRVLKPEDEDAVVALWRGCGLVVPGNDPVRDFQLALTTPTSNVLGGFIDGALVATAMLGFDGHRGWLYYIAVAPAHRGKGFAKRLIKMAEDHLARQGAPKVRLMVRTGNAPASALYQTLGYTLSDVTTLGKVLD